MTKLHSHLKGKTIMITGASSGIGKAAAIHLAEMGAHLVLVCRDRLRSESAIDDIVAKTGNKNIELLVADLRSQSQIRAITNTFLATDQPLHILLNNAGLIIRKRTETIDRIETTFAVNHLSHYLLTRLLIPRIKASAPARIVNVASKVHRYADGRMNFDNINAEKNYHPLRNYSQSKLANILFTNELARRLNGTGITANAFQPGVVASGFAQNIGGLPQLFLTLMRPLMRTPTKGAQTAVYLCASPDVKKMTGKYFSDCQEILPNEAARHEADARRLWEVSAQMTGLPSDTSI